MLENLYETSGWILAPLLPCLLFSRTLCKCDNFKKPCLKPSQRCKKQGVVIFTYEPLSFSEIAQNDVQAAFSECYINKLAKGIGKPVMGRGDLPRIAVFLLGLGWY